VNDEPNLRGPPAQVPAATFTIGLEAPLKFEINARPDGEIARLGDWIKTHPRLLEVWRAAYDAIQETLA
jgi:hypothetical protein